MSMVVGSVDRFCMLSKGRSDLYTLTLFNGDLMFCSAKDEILKKVAVIIKVFNTFINLVVLKI